MLKRQGGEMDIPTMMISAMTIFTNAQEVVVTVVVETLEKDVGILKKIEAVDEEKVGNVQMMIVMTEIMIDKIEETGIEDCLKEKEEEIVIKIDTMIGQVIIAQENMMMINIVKDQTGEG